MIFFTYHFGVYCMPGDAIFTDGDVVSSYLNDKLIKPVHDKGHRRHTSNDGQERQWRHVPDDVGERYEEHWYGSHAEHVADIGDWGTEACLSISGK